MVRVSNGKRRSFQQGQASLRRLRGIESSFAMSDPLPSSASASSVAEKRLIQRTELDAACPDRPVYLVKYDGHYYLPLVTYQPASTFGQAAIGEPDYRALQESFAVPVKVATGTNVTVPSGFTV